MSDASSRQLGLVIEDAAEVVPIREYLGLEGQERSAGIHEVNARQSVFQRDFLGSQMLFHGDGIVGAALHRSVVSDDYAESTSHLTNARNEASSGKRVFVKLVPGQCAELEKGRAGVEQAFYPVPGKELPAGFVPFPAAVVAPGLGALKDGSQRFSLGLMVGFVARKGLLARSGLGGEDCHGGLPCGLDAREGALEAIEHGV